MFEKSSPVVIIALLIILTVVAVGENIKKAEAISLYDIYYHNTETLLDSLNVKGDHIIFTREVGQEYLDAKMQLDEYNQESD